MMHSQTEKCTGPEVPNPTDLDGSIPACPQACTNTPCLFNIFDDPYEYNNLADTEPGLLKEMHAQFLQLVSEYSAPNDPNDPTLEDLIWKYGYHMDKREGSSPGCTMVAQTGWWRPWVNATSLSP